MLDAIKAKQEKLNAADSTTDADSAHGRGRHAGVDEELE